MVAGTVDVRTRDNVRHGKMRIDQLVDHLNTLSPSKSGSFDDFYKNAWNPADFKDVPEIQAESKENPKGEAANTSDEESKQ